MPEIINLLKKGILIVIGCCLPICGFSQTINDFVPKNHHIAAFAYGHLNNDTLTDCALILSKDYTNEKLDEFLVLFKNPKGSYNVVLKTNDYITHKFENELKIEDKKLFLRVEHPWHGMNFRYYTLRFDSGNWVCLQASSDHAYYDKIEQDWNSSIDFRTGKYQLSHWLHLLDGSIKKRSVNGTLKNSKPPVMFNGELIPSTVIHSKKKYALGDRNTLWSEEEISSFIPVENARLVGVWKNQLNEKIVLKLIEDSYFTLTDFNHVTQKFETLKGTYFAVNKTITLRYYGRKPQRFKMVVLNSVEHIQKQGGFDFVKD